MNDNWIRKNGQLCNDKKNFQENAQAIEKLHNFAEKFSIFFKMITKNRRLAIITELVNTYYPNSQGKLLKLLHDRGFTITQTTLSRDIKELNITKIPDEKGNSVYMIPNREAKAFNRFFVKDKAISSSPRGFVSIEFSNQLGVIRTRNGYANGIASEINHRALSVIIGTITSDNIVLLIPREGVTRQEILNTLATFIPGMKKEEDETPETSQMSSPK